MSDEILNKALKHMQKPSIVLLRKRGNLLKPLHVIKGCYGRSIKRDDLKVGCGYGKQDMYGDENRNVDKSEINNGRFFTPLKCTKFKTS